MIICISYIRFYYGLKKQGISRDELPYKSWGQPYVAYATGFFCFLVSFFSGFSVFFPGNFSASAFLSNYISSFVMIVFYIVAKLVTREPFIATDQMDLSEIEAIREERRINEDLVKDPIRRKPFMRRMLEKFIDE